MKNLNYLKLCCRVLIAGAFLGVFGEFAHAKDLHGRFGLGYNQQFSNTGLQNGVPAISLKYGLTRDLALSLIAGVTTASPINTALGGKFYKHLFMERNLNFYYTLGGAMMSGAPAGETDSSLGFEMLAAFGTEFFIPGVESLGWSMEAGALLSNASGSFVLQSMGASFIQAGMHFYF